MKLKRELKTYLLLLLGLFTSQSVFSTPISRQKAQQNVQEFLQQKGIDMKLKTLRQAPMSAEKQMENAPYYVFNIGDDNGFVIASGDDCAYEILGYSDKGNFDADSIPDGMKWMLDFYAKQIEASSGKPANRKAKAATSYPAIAPMLTTKWDQMYPYNANCPMVNGEKCVTGCVATAMAQVLYYHRNSSIDKVTARIPDYTLELWSASGGVVDHRDSLYIDGIPKGAFIDWDNMLDRYYSIKDFHTEEQIQAIANLMLYCGVAVTMEYGVNGSFAYTYMIPFALTKYFDYRQPKLVEREEYIDAKWEEMIYASLTQGDPVIYCGGAHCFVLDGYDGKGYVHVNWGWGGYRDDYFLLSAVEGSAESVLDGFTYNQNAVLFAEPNDRDLESVSLTLRSNRVVENISSLESIPLEFDLEVNNISDDFSTFYVDIWPMKDDDTLSWFNQINDANVTNVPCLGNKILKKRYSIPANISPGYYIFVPYCDRYNSSNELVGKPHDLINHDLYVSMIIKDDKATFCVGKPALSGEYISFTDENVKRICVRHWDIDKDGEINTEELELITDLGTAFKGSSIKTFDELQLFTGLTSIGMHAFEGAKDLTSITIPETVKSIENDAFKATNLSSIVIPKNVDYIYAGAFSETPLSSIIVSQDNKRYDSRNNCNAIIETSSNTLIVGCQNTVIPEDILVIGNKAFSGCSKLKSITLPESLTKIGNEAFKATKLNAIVIPKNVEKISSDAFFETSLTSITISEENKWYDSRNNCNAIIETSSNTLIVGCQNSVIPEDILEIGDKAFLGCQKLTSITLPESLTKIGDEAFKSTNLHKISIPKNVKSIGKETFSYTSLWDIEVDSNNQWFDSRYYCNAIIKSDNNQLVAGCENTYIPNDVSSIGRSAFAGVKGDEYIEIPKSVTTIYGDAFKDSGFKTVKIWNVTNWSYAKGAFDGCDELTSIQIYMAQPPKIYEGSSPFSDKTYKNATLYVPFGAKAAYKEASVWRYFSNIVEKEDTVKFEDEKIKQICVDNWDISGDGEVSDYELSLVTNLNGVFADFQNDGGWRFDNTFWELSYFTGLTSIGDYEFWNSTIYSVSIPENVTRIGDNAFYSLNGIYIPKNVSRIGNEAFGNSLQSIYVDPENKWYDSRNDCNAIIETATNTLIQGCEKTVIPNDVKIIGDGAFAYYYTGNISIPVGVTSIGYDAFRETSMSSVTIPKSVKEIKVGAFSYCDFLESVFVNWLTPIEIDESVFSSWGRDDIYEHCTLYIPRGTKAKYETAEVWKKFFKIEEFGKLVGDVNGDDVVNILDVTMMVSRILGNEVESFDETVADMNDDGKINIVDVTSLVNIILGK